MSKAPQDHEASDFWEFVSCSKCRMPFALENGSATVPFWLTECGHVVCNNHLSPDQSCSQCGSQGIQLTPLHREMEAPMSDWFQDIPSALESVAYAAKFQQVAMASQLRYHRSRHQQLRQLIERLKREVIELKRANDTLRHENEQYRTQSDQPTGNNEIPDVLNANGKRQMNAPQQFEYDNRRSRNDSSPCSITTPLGPNRLTLQPGQALLELSSHKQQEQPHQSTSNQPQEQYLQQRPVSTRLEKYAYVPQESNAFHPPQLSHAQAAPRFFQPSDRARTDILQQDRRLNTASNQLPPPSSRFKPPTNTKPFAMSNASNNIPAPRQMAMGPPPTPQHFRGDMASQSNNTANRQRSMQQMNNPSLPPNRRSFAVPATPISGQHANATQRRFFQIARGPSRASVPTEGQRTPFFPHNGPGE